MSKPVTQQEIAARLQLHLSTVSLALRDNPRLKKATRERVQQAAQTMGYSPNPNARALALYGRARQPVAQHGAIALLSPQLFHSIYLDGAREQGRQLGYQVDMLAYRDPILSKSRLTQILRARGITGLLVLGSSPASKLLKRLNLDWPQFSAVSLGQGLLWPQLHRVSDNPFRNMKQLVRKLGSLGYRRIGFYSDRHLTLAATEGGWRGGYLAEMERWGKCPPPLYRDGETYDGPAIRRWIRVHRLDAVITAHDYAAQQVITLSRRRVPEDLGVVSLACSSDLISGILPQFAEIGSTAVNFLTHLMNTNQRGIPTFPQRTLIEGTWFPGSTVRRVIQKST